MNIKQFLSFRLIVQQIEYIIDTWNTVNTLTIHFDIKILIFLKSLVNITTKLRILEVSTNVRKNNIDTLHIILNHLKKCD